MLVVADTSVLLNLCCIHHQHLLLSLFGEVHIPTAVRIEFERLTQNLHRFQGLALPNWVTVTAVQALTAARRRHSRSRCRFTRTLS